MALKANTVHVFNISAFYTISADQQVAEFNKKFGVLDQPVTDPKDDTANIYIYRGHSL